jgi:predicted secreted protein
MARVHGKNWHSLLNSVGIDATGQTITMNINADTSEVTAADDTSKEYVVGNYGWDISVDGAADFGTSLQDATMFAQIVTDGTEEAWVFNPDTATSATTNPQYTGNVIATSYSITAGVGDAVTFSYSAIGNGNLARTTA